MKLINKDVLVSWARELEQNSKAPFPQVSISKLVKFVDGMDAIDIPMTVETYRGKHERRG